jgi:hypothetical protein
MAQIEGELGKHLSLHAAQILVGKAAGKLRDAAFRLLHNMKDYERGLPDEGKGYDDVIVRQLYRAVHALEKAQWEISRRTRRRARETILASGADPATVPPELPLTNPEATDFSKFLPKIHETKVPWKWLTDELMPTLIRARSFLTADPSQSSVIQANYEHEKKAVAAALFQLQVFIDQLVESVEKDAP